MSGVFITFEGIDGCGKTSHIEALVAELESQGIKPVLTREPGGTRIGEQIRELVLSKSSAGLVPAAELMLYAADRAEHVAKVIKPALAAGRIVLCDRHTDSTVAFQGYGRRLDLGLIQELNRIATAGVKPDLTVLLDLDPALARARLSSRGRKGPQGETLDRLDDEHDEFHRRVRDGYLKLAAIEPERIHLVHSGGPFDEVRREVFDLVTRVIESKRV